MPRQPGRRPSNRPGRESINGSLTVSPRRTPPPRSRDTPAMTRNETESLADPAAAHYNITAYYQEINRELRQAFRATTLRVGDPAPSMRAATPSMARRSTWTRNGHRLTLSWCSVERAHRRAWQSYRRSRQSPVRWMRPSAGSCSYTRGRSTPTPGSQVGRSLAPTRTSR
jgi:hypothetical protein